ncbi:Nitrogen assimilation transcription factor nit-4 [Cryomyces antarcticus]|nr:Nitrogen assimilation transcription factor nit-4 [Cryomyces antarcticus]
MDADTSHVQSEAKWTFDEPNEDTARKPPRPRIRNRKKDSSSEDAAKRRCVSTADGSIPACAACSSVYGTECIYDPNSDHRRKGVYKKDIDGKTKNTTLQTLIQAILNYPEDEVPALVRQIRTCESLEAVADAIVAKEKGLEGSEEDYLATSYNDMATPTSPTFETQLSGQMGELRLDEGTVRYIGGTSNLIFLGSAADYEDTGSGTSSIDQYQQQENPITSWTAVTLDSALIIHLLNMYFTWHYTYFTTLSKTLFCRDFLLGKPPPDTRRKTEYCTPLLVNAILALGCHFTSMSAAREDPEDSTTAGDHFFKEAKRLILENDEHEKPKLTTVQALALMSVREAGCGREAKGWVYSGMSFRMACDLGLNLDTGGLASNKDTGPDEVEEDARRITFWGCFLFDKCWSNYLGRLPQLPRSIITVPKFEVFPDEDAEPWSPYTDSGFSQTNAQPSRTRAVARQISALCEISNDLMNFFYNPSDMDKVKVKHAELKKLSEIHVRLENWRRSLPKEMEPRDGGLSSVLVMHMFFQLLYIHLFRPFLQYNRVTSPLPALVSPRKYCTQAASTISKLLRLYKRSHGLRQICNIAVYIAHSACTIHLLNQPEKNASRDIIHGVKHLEEIAEGWLCARRSLGILSVLARKWNVALPEDAASVLARTDVKFGGYHGEVQSPKSAVSPPKPPQQVTAVSQPQTDPWQAPLTNSVLPNGYFNSMPASPSNPSLIAPQSTGSFAALSQSAADFQIRNQQYPPHATSDPGTRQRTNSRAAAPRTSPSDLFGGVDSLLKDEGEWVFRDQAQLATGFGNWADASWMNSTNDGTWGGAQGYPVSMSETNGLDGLDSTILYGYASGYKEEERYL